MNAFWRASAVCLSSIFGLLRAWQYIVDPRTPEGRPPQVVRRLSRAMFGERCLETYEIADRQGPVAYARKLWRIEEFKLTALGDEDTATVVFRSALFRNGGNKGRDFSGIGWLAGRSGFDGWHVSYSVSNPTVAGLRVRGVHRLPVRDEFRKQDIQLSKVGAIWRTFRLLTGG